MDGDRDIISNIRTLIDNKRMREALDKANQIENPKQRAAAFLLIAKKALELEESSITPFYMKDLFGLFTDTPCKILTQALRELARLGYSDIAKEIAEGISDPLCYAKSLESIAKGELDLTRAQYEMIKANIKPAHQLIAHKHTSQTRSADPAHSSSLEPNVERRCKEITLMCPQQHYEQVFSNTLINSLKRLQRVKIDAKTFYLVKCTRFSCVLIVNDYAIKVPPPLLSGEYFRSTFTEDEISEFISEAEKALLLDHPNVIKLHDYLVDPPLLVYERADCDLELILSRNGPLSFEEVVRVVADICKGLIYIHSKGFIHGDLKPQNVLLVKGRVKIGDLGALVNIIRLSTTSRFEFTPIYCAPEQTKLGNWRSVSKKPSKDFYAIDVYQLANLILELLGINPLSGLEWSIEGLKQRLNLLYEKYRDNELVELVGRMLSREPFDRPSLSEVERVMLELATGSCKEVGRKQ